MKIEHILVTSDLSPEALRPCAPVEQMAKDLNARVTLLNVVQDLKFVPHGAPFAPAVSSPDVEHDLKHARLALEDQAKLIDASIRVDIDVVASSTTAQAVCDYAKEHDVDLIAISTHGRTGFRHLALGSVAEAIIRHSEVPVLVFPRPKE